MFLRLLTCVALLGVAGFSQTTPVRTVRAYGEGTVSIRPDQAKISINVVTQGQTAQEAAEANANQSATLLSALRGVLGASADIRTTSYSIVPNYRYPSGGGLPTLTGYTATAAWVAIVGNIRGSASAANSTALYPAIDAIEESASMLCARVMRGIISTERRLAPV